MDHENIVAKMSEDVEGSLKTVGIEEVGNHHGQAGSTRLCRVGLGERLGVGFTVGVNVGQKPEDFEDASLAALWLQFGFDAVGKGDDVDAVQIRQADVAESGRHSTRIIQLRRLAVV